MQRPLRLLALALVPLLAFLASQESGAPAPVDLAGGERPGVLAFEVRERDGARIPARLTFVPAGDAARTLFTNTAAAPGELAARGDLVYSRSGAGRITVPPGSYTVFASRGLEWSLASRALELAPGEEEELAFELVHELDTDGWIGADFHLHTLTYSGHGDAGMEERVLACLGEGLELAVATDHDHHTDYRPTLRALGLEGALAAITGNEVTTPIGHFNAFPLDPSRPPVDPRQEDANVLFRALRAESGPSGVAPVIQLNHPRLANIDYFGQRGLDPVTGTSPDPRYSREFDALEILNGNTGGGYLDPVADRAETHGHRHSVLADWFHLLDLGERPSAVGNSDSHHVRAIVAGYPRNFLRAASDDPARLAPAEVAAAVRAHELFTTTGPFVELAVEGVAMGGDARARDGHARLELRVRAASWVDCDRAKVFVNGELAATLPIGEARAVERLRSELELCFRGACTRHARPGPVSERPFDGWVVVVVEGDDPLAPLLSAEAKPLAIANPVWVDGDGDGKFTCARERVAERLRAQPTPDLARTWFLARPPAEQALALSLVPRGPVAAVLLEAGLSSPARAVRLAAARAAERHVMPGAVATVQRVWSQNQDDPFLGALLLRVLVAARREQGPASVLGYAKRFGEGALRAYGREIVPLFPDGDVTSWQVLGPLAPGTDPASSAPPGPGPTGSALDWSGLDSARADGYVDLRDLGGGATEHTRVFAQVYLRPAQSAAVPCFFGSDDAARVWVNERLVYENRARKSADPLETLLSLELAPGWNRLVLEIENATGAFGFYCRLLDPSVEVASSPP